MIPGCVLVIPGCVLVSPGRVLVIPGCVLVIPGRVLVIPGRVLVSPGRVLVTPGCVLAILLPHLFFWNSVTFGGGEGGRGGGGKEESRILRLWDLKCVGRVKMLLIRWRSVNCFMHCSCLKCKYSCASLAVRFPYKVLMVQCSHKYALFG